eukprot:COSAG05_NODE_1221_length_5476_cov_72.306305_3_plen_113_part_00
MLSRLRLVCCNTACVGLVQAEALALQEEAARAHSQELEQVKAELAATMERKATAAEQRHFQEVLCSARDCVGDHYCARCGFSVAVFIICMVFHTRAAQCMDSNTYDWTQPHS